MDTLVWCLDCGSVFVAQQVVDGDWSTARPGQVMGGRPCPICDVSGNYAVCELRRLFRKDSIRHGRKNRDRIQEIKRGFAGLPEKDQPKGIGPT